MNYQMFETEYEFYKLHYEQIENRELYKWKAVKHFQDNWDIEAEDFSSMLDEALRKTGNLMSAGQYFPRRMIKWAAKEEPNQVRELFRALFDLSGDLKERIESFRLGVNSIVENHKSGKIQKSYQDDRAIMVYLNLKYPDKYYLYKYTMFVNYAKLIDYAELPKAGDIDLIFVFHNMCEMIHKRVLQDEQLLLRYEERKNKYYDPNYHLLVQDIVYSVNYFNIPEIFEQEQKVETKKFNLHVETKDIILKGSHVDYLEEAKSNKQLGDAGEEFVYQYERMLLKSYGLNKKKQVRRVAKLDGDGLGYDILSYDKKGNEKYIEVKTTSGSENSSIYITSNELKMSEENADNYYLYRVFDFDKKSMSGKIAIREGSLKELCVSAQTYKVDFKV